MRKDIKGVVALIYLEKKIKIVRCTFLDNYPKKLDGFALNLQYVLSLQGVGQDKTKETLV